MGYDGRLLHGEAVAVGMICAMELSVRKGWLNESDVQAVRAHMKEVGLKITIEQAGLPEDVDLEKLYERMFSDKKVKAGTINFVVMKAIGQAFLENSIEKEDVMAVLASCYEA
jgi:3-dehydroquinate synthase